MVYTLSDLVSLYVERNEAREHDADAERWADRLCPPEVRRRIPDSRERKVLAHDHTRRTGLADGAAGVDVGAGVRVQGTRRGGAGRTAGHRSEERRVGKESR